MYGTDALRFALTTGTAPGNDQRLSEEKLESSRNFVNKLWNASRFVMGSVKDGNQVQGWYSLPAPSHREDRWILSRLNRVVGKTRDYLERFEIGEAQREVYDFFWNEYCDWYIELAKVRLREGRSQSPLPVLAHVLEKTLRLLHPFMPFVTEEVWLRLTERLPAEGELSESIMIAPYPTEDQSKIDPEAEGEMSQLITLVRSIRNVRAQLRIGAGQELQAVVDHKGHHYLVGEEAQAIKSLAKLGSLDELGATGRSEEDGMVKVVAGEVVVGLPLSGVMDLSRERQRLMGEAEEASRHLKRVDSLLSRAEFMAKAPGHVVERERERAAGLRQRLERLEEVLAQLPG